MNAQQLFFYTAIVVCAIVFFRLVNQVISMSTEERTKAWLYIYLLGFLASFAYITSRALNGFSNGGNIPMAAHGFCLLASLGIYSFLIRRNIKKLSTKNNANLST
jgi:hypothetical protein